MDNNNTEKVKRKTKTSTEVKRRYNEKNYDKLTVLLPKGLVETLRQVSAREDCSQRQIITNALTKYLADEYDVHFESGNDKTV